MVQQWVFAPASSAVVRHVQQTALCGMKRFCGWITPCPLVYALFLIRFGMVHQWVFAPGCSAVVRPGFPEVRFLGYTVTKVCNVWPEVHVYRSSRVVKKFESFASWI